MDLALMDTDLYPAVAVSGAMLRLSGVTLGISSFLPPRSRDGCSWRVFLVSVACAMVSCDRDSADEAYFRALAGDEDGSTRQEQIALMDEAIRQKSDRARYWETRAIYRIDVGDLVGAEADLDEAIRLDDRSYLRFLRGLVRCGRGDCRGALPDLDLAIVVQPENNQFYRARSLARSATGDGVGALADAELLLGREPQSAFALNAQGVALFSLGRDDAAIVSWTRAIALQSDLVYSIENRAVCWDRLGQPARATADREAAARIRSEKAGCAPCLDPFRY